jgi:hypothetical protein
MGNVSIFLGAIRTDPIELALSPEYLVASETPALHSLFSHLFSFFFTFNKFMTAMTQFGLVRSIYLSSTDFTIHFQVLLVYQNEGSSI